uniref:Uncharacterized protein n=1 Tax=Schistocephalus solidus TaxID=70667 RepID=A0A0X3NQ20_SCHSO
MSNRPILLWVYFEHPNFGDVHLVLIGCNYIFYFQTAVSGLSPVYPWILPSVELPSEFLTLQQSAYTNQCCSCARHSQTVGASSGTNLCYVPPSPPQPLQFPCITETALAAAAAAPETTTASTANAEFDTAALLRAWYEAGYAMGQAHAEQVLGVRKGKSVSTIGTGNSSFEQ